MTDVRPSNKPQMDNAAFRLAALDHDFILGDRTRGIRFQLEYEKAEETLRARKIETTVVVFGSARPRPCFKTHSLICAHPAATVSSSL